MIHTYRYKGATWIDLLSPTTDEVEQIRKEYALSARVAEDLLSPTLRHTVEFGDKHAYLVLHFPAFRDAGEDAAFELDFVVGDTYIITTHYKPMETLIKFGGSLTELSSETTADARDTIFFGILASLMASFDKKLSEVDHWVREVETNMFKGKEKLTIFELSEASRHLIDFKKITAVYPDAFSELRTKGIEVFGSDFGDRVDLILATFAKAHEKLELLAESVKELRETNASLLSTKQNETMKMLTVFTIVATVIVGIALIWLGYMALK